ncbi:MAG: hypothetical protein FWE16_04510 [Firmicutes bacterium]|nr:hypothetical protein [Bacillota bacterium]
MNLRSEQIRSDLSLDIALDQPLTPTKMMDAFIACLGKERCSIEIFAGRKTLVYTRYDGIKDILLFAAITYLGGNGQHPIFKKRIQLQQAFKNVYLEVANNSQYNVRFMGVYHYEGNIVFADFVKETYLQKRMNNSAAHIYINDLFQAMRNGVFEKIDNFGNKIISIRFNKLKSYFNNEFETKAELFKIFEDFNSTLGFNNWITAQNAITEMYVNKWSQWKQTEWPGWFLEFKIDHFIKSNKLEHTIRYVGSSQKKNDDLDFDLYFAGDKFYGDLKASDMGYDVSPGNDQEAFIECINKYDRFWYVIYEHNTIKDKDRNFEATKFRSHFLRDNDEWNKRKEFDELSYSSRMKNQVQFVNMVIIELNRINFRNVLSNFNQGRQTDGNARRVKFLINKRNLDNFVVYRCNQLFEVQSE